MNISSSLSIRWNAAAIFHVLTKYFIVCQPLARFSEHPSQDEGAPKSRQNTTEFKLHIEHQYQLETQPNLPNMLLSKQHIHHKEHECQGCSTVCWLGSSKKLSGQQRRGKILFYTDQNDEPPLLH